MIGKLLCALLLVTTVAGTQTPPLTKLNLNGSWTFNTTSDDGVPVSGSIELTGGPAAYAGAMITADGRRTPITEIAISPKAIYMIAELPDGAVVVRVVPDSTGNTLVGVWGAARPMLPVTATRKRD